MAEGKWVAGLTGETAPLAAARRVLAERLHVVRHYLPLAIQSPHEDVEHVHQLRVGTRRAGSAIRIFSAYLSQKRDHTLRKTIRKIRRAAAEARDWDVFQQSLTDWSCKRPANEQPGLDFLRGFAFFQRQAAQSALNQMADTAPGPLEHDDFVHHEHHGRLADLAVQTLQTSLDELTQLLDQPSGDYEHLHQIRITGKRLRYGMEIFVDCFVPQFRDEVYPAIEQMQEILGDANDCHVAAQRLVQVRDRLQLFRPDDWPRMKPGIEKLLEFNRRRLPQQRRKFMAWTKRWRAAQTPLAEMLRQA